jgi:hypothetical protein
MPGHLSRVTRRKASKEISGYRYPLDASQELAPAYS